MKQDTIDTIISYRRTLHTIPELANREFKTTKFLKEVVFHLMEEARQRGIYMSLHHGSSTGFWVNIRLVENDDTAQYVAFRADMDALPAQEASSYEFRSHHDGVAHNCGHDLHMAIALGLIYSISTGEVVPNENVRVIFQPAEEQFVGGAEKMIEAGCLRDVKRIFGLHNIAEFKTGEVRLCKGIIMAAGDQFKIIVGGKAAHGSTPQLAKDALGEAVRLINELKNIVSHEINPAEMKLITVCTMNAGVSSNTIADYAEFEGSYRSFRDAVQDQMCEKIENLVQESCNRGFRTEFHHQGYPAVVNREDMIEQVVEACHVANVKVSWCSPINGSEDFSYYGHHVPSAFFFLGSGNEEIHNPLHSNPYYTDEECLQHGVNIFAALIS